jgi:hypothetical protein
LRCPTIIFINGIKVYDVKWNYIANPNQTKGCLMLTLLSDVLMSWYCGFKIINKEAFKKKTILLKQILNNNEFICV